MIRVPTLFYHRRFRVNLSLTIPREVAGVLIFLLSASLLRPRVPASSHGAAAPLCRSTLPILCTCFQLWQDALVGIKSGYGKALPSRASATTARCCGIVHLETEQGEVGGRGAWLEVIVSVLSLDHPSHDLTVPVRCERAKWSVLETARP